MREGVFTMGMVCSGMALAVGAESIFPARPNIVLIMADDLGWADVSYNQTEADRAARNDLARTPEIDRICAQGVRFERFYAQPICTPTRAALMTGRYAWRTGMASGVVLNHLEYGLPLDETTLADCLRDAGYATYIVGKWHLGHHTPDYLPTERGFDYHYGLYTAIDHFTRQWQGGHDWHRNREPVREEGYATDLLAADCERIIAEHDFGKKPMFLYHAMFAPHAWNQSTAEYMAPYAHVEDRERRGLLGLLAAMDSAFGRTVAALEKAGQLENTLVFFLSDNGGSSPPEGGKRGHRTAYNGLLRDGKGSYYEGGIRVPAFAFWPGRIEAGRSTQALAHVTDLFPTFAKLAGARLPEKPLDGFDLSPVLFSEADSSGRREIAFILEDSERLRRGAVIDWPWKLRRTAQENGPWVHELYNIDTDPHEKVSGHDTARAHPELTARLSRRLDELNRDAPPAFWKKGDGQAPPGWKAPPVIGPDQ